LAVEAFAVGGMAIGVPVGPTEKAFLKPLVQCAVDGRPVLECGKEALIQTVLGELPGESRAFAGCIAGGGNVARCATSEMIKKLPPQARSLASCVAQGRDVSDCGKRIATGQLTEAQRNALATLGNVKADGQVSLTRSTSSIQNIINVADGIVRGDWETVAINGGKVAAKYVIRSVLTALLSQAGSALAGPVIDGLVENRMDLAIDLINALKSGDPGRIARALVQAYLYLGLPVVQACSLLPSGAVKEAVCGLVGDILRGIADVGGKVVDTAADEAEEKYNALADFLTGNRDDCGTRWKYYDANFAFCKHHAAIAKNLDPGKYAKMEESLYQGCRAHFHPCAKRLIGSTSDRISDICNPVRDKFRTEVDAVSSGLKDRATAFARSYPPLQLQLEKGEDCDARASQQFFIDCTKALQDQDRLASTSCRVDGKKLGMAFSHSNACLDAAFVGTGDTLRLSFRATCTYPPDAPPRPVLKLPPPRPLPLQVVKPPPPRSCQGGMVGTPPNCRCPQGTTWRGDRCVPLTCQGGMVGTPPNCRCGGGTVLVGGRCVPPCPAGMVGTPPNCRCPGGTVLSGGRCVPPCPAGMVGTPPNCRCAGGTVLSGGRCVPPCPPGMVGTPPYCRCPGGTFLSGGRCTQCPPGTTWSGGRCTPVSCPPGMEGRPPNCYRRACPPGMVGTPPNCYRRACPPGMVGTFPNCHRLPPPPPRVCPPGMVGAPPNCRVVPPPRGCPQGYTPYQGRCVPSPRFGPKPRPAVPDSRPCPPRMFRGGDGQCYPRLN
jgi:hypothetical protein